MRNLNIVFEDTEWATLERVKAAVNASSWRELILLAVEAYDPNATVITEDVTA